MTSARPVCYRWIDADGPLAALCASWLTQPAIAIDTEFMRSHTFFPHVGLLQIADADSVYLIDPLKIQDKSALIDVLQRPSVVKVMHSCSQDLEVFHHYLGVLPEPIFDTQIAAAFTGLGSAISYANLLKHLLGLDIPKQETRSNWLQRPLSDAQLDYAVRDVAYLLPVYAHMRSQLQRQQRLPWVEFDCRQLLEKVRYSLERLQDYTRVKSAWKLNRQQLAVLATLYRWREKLARRQDIPRNRIVADAVIWELAAKIPINNNQLKTIKQLCLRRLAQYGDTLLALVNKVLASDANSYPELLPRPLSIEQRQIVKLLKAEVETIAIAHHLPPELLMRKKDYQGLLHSGLKNDDYQLPASLKNWRQPLLEKPLLGLLAGLGGGSSS